MAEQREHDLQFLSAAEESSVVIDLDSEPTVRARWRPLEKLLVEEGVLTSAQAEELLSDDASLSNEELVQRVLEEQLAPEASVMRCLAMQFGRQFVSLKKEDLDASLLELLPQELMQENSVLPLKLNDGVLTVATAEPGNVMLFDVLQRQTGRQIRTVVACRSEINQCMEELQQSDSGAQVEELMRDITDDSVEVVESESEELPDLEKVAGESPIIRLANYIISTAVQQGASDIHIEPMETRLRVRYRIDGILFETMQPPLSMHAALISRIKIMSNLDISERRLPQDGRIRAMIQSRTVDLRVSTLPTASGEKCVIRVLDNNSIMLGLERLGFSEDNLALFQNEIAQPHGIILVTGPTGSGKTTTLYSALMELKSDTLNISTVEDPVEYRLDFANQVQVIDRIGMSFSAALRSLLRQDPDVIMVGEIRDEETARIAVQAALTGHLVLSTLHTNDAPSSITRLINIGIESYLIAAALNAVIAQRLVRRICPQCKEEWQPSQEVSDYLAAQGLEDITLMRGKGCQKCRNTGYSGRVALYEMLVMDDTVRDFVTTNPSVTQLRRLLHERGMSTLRDDGLDKVRQGSTTIEEVLRVTESIR